LLNEDMDNEKEALLWRRTMRWLQLTRLFEALPQALVYPLFVGARPHGIVSCIGCALRVSWCLGPGTVPLLGRTATKGRAQHGMHVAFFGIWAPRLHLSYMVTFLGVVVCVLLSSN